MNVSFHFDRFIFDPDTGDLLKSGVRVRLSMQTATILELLLMQAGRIVSREDIKDALWPEHEYLSHDKVINNGIGRLRRVFEDDYLNCKYIECVPGFGYRFKSEVKQLKVDHEVPRLYVPAPKPAYINVPDRVAQSMAAVSDNQHSLMEDEVSTAALAGKLWNLGFQALDRTRPLLPLSAKKTRGWTNEYVRHGTQALLAALEIASGRVVAHVKQRRTSVNFLRFLKDAVEAFPKQSEEIWGNDAYPPELLQ